MIEFFKTFSNSDSVTQSVSNNLSEGTVTVSNKILFAFN